MILSKEKAASELAGVESASFPVADVKPVGRFGGMLQSKMWWITLLCLGIAIYLAWNSHKPTGIPIVIDFPEGHGLKTGDALQHRGIEIGIVTSVELADDLQGVRANVSLQKSAAGVANDNSQFWIVRPQLSLTNISGLETAVGSKYIAVDPGSVDSPHARKFTGLSDPPFGIHEDGIEVMLRGGESFGINPGSPVAYRGLKVGQIVSMELGDNSQSVLLQARILKEYQGLLRRGSKFWKTSGVDLDFGIKGFHLNTNSLASMAQGGVSFSTPTTRDSDDLLPITPGHEFELFEEVDEDWIRDAAPIQLD